MKSRILIPSLCGLAISACGGGGGGDGGGNFFCESLSGGNATVTTQTCGLGCSISNAERAADGDLDSFASATNNFGQSMSIRATAQAGIVYGVGSQPGVMFLADSSDNITMRTYLDGALQESWAFPGNGRLEGTGGGNPYSYLSFYATKQFDAVEFGMASTTPIEVHEICHNGNSD